MYPFHRLTRPVFLGMACAAGLMAAVPLASPAAESSVIQVLRDYEDVPRGDRRPAILYWNWTPEQKASALEYSSVAVVGGAAVGKGCLSLTVSERLPRRDPGYRVVALGIDYLPPEADAVRLRVKVLRGRFTIALGGPTVYFGHSDVLTKALTLDAASHGEWSTVELSLHHDLTRNYRRSQWARHAPRIYYTRWIQEPLGIELAAGSAGEMLLDQVELLARGEGRPYPTFKPAEIQTVAPSIDFEQPASMARAFTVMTEMTAQPKFDREPNLVRQGWPPPQLARVAEGRNGRHALEMVMTGAEEVCFAGLQVAGVAAANAVALTVKAEYAGREQPGVVLDFLVYAAPPQQHSAFPWDGLRPPVSWRDNRELAFTYYLSRTNAAVEPATFGFYHTRRLAPNKQWCTLVLPLADFICCYGQGAMRSAFEQQTPLVGDRVFALTFLSYFGQNSKPLRLLIDDVRFVAAPGTPESLRSFYQAPGMNRRQ